MLNILNIIRLTDLSITICAQISFKICNSSNNSGNRLTFSANYPFSTTEQQLKHLNSAGTSISNKYNPTQQENNLITVSTTNWTKYSIFIHLHIYIFSINNSQYKCNFQFLTHQLLHVHETKYCTYMEQLSAQQML